ncbi:hypothetical protein C2E20_5405 [Micractinium conductrix]|uniref:Uncharacterized protein n=1 Tax=Micractinium conductrix TaxID=554055 RepID=A0A2P6VB42_9CHLO|nr:hypothetical protein C2E20_5405 [Micractinium conductrix]|eukprot:PSC71271.1 hypothetical protein C2E20_5405 [Micractinium conductrix]
MALLKLHAALELAGHLRDAVGDDAGWRALLKQEKLALAVADAQLARDKASDFVAAVQRRAAANQIDCPD